MNRGGGRSREPGRRALVPVLLALVQLAVVAVAAVALAQEPPPGPEPDPAALRDVFPGATRFGPFEGEPPAAPAYRGDELAGYAFTTRQVVASVGYSGKPLNVLVGLSRDGRITGARILEQNEPILVIGVGEEELGAFVAQYRGLDIREPVRVSRAGGGENAVDAVSGATISSTVINDAILRSARAVARSRGILGEAAARLQLADHAPADWETLRAEGSLVDLDLTVGEVEATLAEKGARLYPEGAGPDPGATFSELHFGLATPARVGRNLLGERLYNRAMAELAEGDHLIFVAGRGLYSFKGTAYRRGDGLFDRIQIVQGERTIRLRRDDHRRVDELAVDGAPPARELALFTLDEETGFDPVEPWRLELLVEGARPDGGEAYVGFGESYTLPARYLREPSPPPAAAAAEAEPLWRQVWAGRTVDIAVLGVVLASLTAILFFQDALVRDRRRHRVVRLVFLSFTLLWIGWYAAAQLSVVNVLTFAESLRTEFRWSTFLLDPMMFILWSYVAIGLLFWGRGVFCGWLCPFGALQELSNRAGRRLGVPQYRVPFAVHERLWPIKYIAFIVLFALSLGSMLLAVEAAEIEPFKTAIVLRFDRAWPFVLYALGLLAIGLFVERAFCRYLCPLGAAFAIPAKLRQFEWLKRHRQCGSPCQICAVDCPVQAIHPDGRINPNECIYCLTCQTNYYDDHVCPPMIERRKRREQREAAIARRRAERDRAAEPVANAKMAGGGAA